MPNTIVEMIDLTIGEYTFTFQDSVARALCAALQTALAGKEASANKVTAFQSTPDDSHYPSEKLVKDSLDLKLNSSLKGANNGVAELNSSGKVPASQLPTIPDVSTKYDTGDTAETTLDDADYIPFYDTSAIASRKSLWSNIKSKLKTYFDGFYLTQHQNISGKADKVVPTDEGNVAFLDSSGNLKDQGVSDSDLFDALDKRHFHSNKTILDYIPSSLGTAGECLVVNSNGTGLVFSPIRNSGGLTNYDLTFSTLANNTTNITFEANQQCYKRMTMTAGATLNFSVLNKGCNYLRIYNSSASDITLAIGTITFNDTAVTTKIVPDDAITVSAGKYVEIGVAADAAEADITVSGTLKAL